MKLKLTVVSIEENKIILRTDEDFISWPKNKLPDTIKLGDDLYFEINETTTEPEKNNAKKILNELLNIE